MFFIDIYSYTLSPLTVRNEGILKYMSYEEDVKINNS